MEYPKEIFPHYYTSDEAHTKIKELSRESTGPNPLVNSGQSYQVRTIDGLYLCPAKYDLKTHSSDHFVVSF